MHGNDYFYHWKQTVEGIGVNISDIKEINLNKSQDKEKILKITKDRARPSA